MSEASGVRAVLVEDEAIIRLSLRVVLRDLGIDVCGETDRAEDSLALVRNTAPDFVLMDIKLKGEMTGIEAARDISAELETPIIFMSAYDFEDQVGLENVPTKVAYLKKPVTGADLAESLKFTHRDKS